MPVEPTHPIHLEKLKGVRVRKRRYESAKPGYKPTQKTSFYASTGRKHLKKVGLI
jgi:hypothetical protein